MAFCKRLRQRKRRLFPRRLDHLSVDSRLTAFRENLVEPGTLCYADMF